MILTEEEKSQLITIIVDDASSFSILNKGSHRPSKLQEKTITDYFKRYVQRSVVACSGWQPHYLVACWCSAKSFDFGNGEEVY